MGRTWPRSTKAMWGMAGALVLGLLSLWPSAALAGGSLDSSFGTNGVVTTSFGSATEDAAADLAIDGDGRVVAAGRSDGQVAVARYLQTGALDSSFGGGDGVATTNFGRLEDYFGALAVDSSDRIVVVATTSGDTSCTDCDIAVARFTSTGELDPGFGGGDGKVVTDMGNGLSNSGSDMAIDTSGRIVVVGTVRREDPPDFSDFAVVRYTEAGDLDSSFDGDGRVTTDFDGVTQSARRVALDGSGRVIVAGETAVGGGFAFAVARYLDTGALDTGFSADGKVVTDVAPGQNTFSTGLMVDAGNRVLLGGTVFAGSPASKNDVALLRYLTTGSLDPSFGAGGIVRTPTGSEGSGGGLAVDGSGRIVLAGSQSQQLHSDVALRRYLSDGSLDPGFGAGGLVEADLGTASSDYASGVALDSDGRIVIAGATGPPGAEDFAVARFLSEGAFVPPPKQPPLGEPSEPSEPPVTEPPSVTPVVPPPAPAAIPAQPPSRTAKPQRCRRGFKKRKVRGKSKCVKVKPAPHRRRGRG